MGVKRTDNSINYSSDARPLLPGRDRGANEPLTCMGILRKSAAFLSLLMMMACWIGEGVTIQTLNTSANWNNMFFVSYATRLGWSVILLGWYFWSICVHDERAGGIPSTGVFTWVHYFKWGFVLGFGILMSTYTWYLSLGGTTVAGNSAVYQSAPVFVFLISIVLLKEKVTPLKCFAVVMCVGGSAAVAFLSTSSPDMVTGRWYMNATLTNASISSHRSWIGGPTCDDCKTSCKLQKNATSCDAVSCVTWPPPSLNSMFGPDDGKGVKQCTGYKVNQPANYEYKEGVQVDLLVGQPGNELSGYAWCLCSVVLYAAYEVLYKKFACSDDDPVPKANTQRFFGVLGVVTVLTCWPIFLLLNGIGQEKFMWPDKHQWELIVLVIFCDTGFNIFLLVTIVLTSPLFTSVGTILVIPLSSLVDYLAFGTVLPAKAFIGVGMIVLGFAAIVYAEYKDHHQKDEMKTMSTY